MKTKLYNELASWWPLLSAPADYAEEAAFYRQKLISACRQTPRSLLELGCGGGNNAFHLKHHFEMTLTDISQDMLAVSRDINPECRHQAGDMRTLRLGQQFDCIFIHDAIDYMISENELSQAIETAYLHCKAGGAALFAPDFIRENFQPSTSHGGHDGENRSLRYLEWTWDPDPDDATYICDYAYLLREKDGKVRVEQDRHLNGLFAKDDWIGMIASAGFKPAILPFEHSEFPESELWIFVGKKH